MQNFHHLVDAVQQNCYITDARYARNMTMCTYLLEMRQYYRWENDIPYSKSPPKDELGNWMVERENLWNTVEESPYSPLRVGSDLNDPFDSESINQKLLPEGYVYSGGYGRFHKPHFFLGELLKEEKRNGFTILVSGCEYARDLISPPAALLNRTIYLRREAVRRYIWDKFEEWNWKKRDNTQASAFSFYDFQQNPNFALEIMTENESEAMILHELGEGMAGDLLGEGWPEMLSVLTSVKAEIMARAVRDHMADCLSTLPALLEREAVSSLHFYFANFNGMRKVLFPRVLKGYQTWVASGDIEPLAEAVCQGKDHWSKVGQQLLDIYNTHGENSSLFLENLLTDGNSVFKF